MYEQDEHDKNIINVTSDQSSTESLLPQKRSKYRLNAILSDIALTVWLGVLGYSVADALGCEKCNIFKKAPEYLPYCYTEDEFNKLHENDDVKLTLNDNKSVDLKLNDGKTKLDIIPSGKPNYAPIVEKSTVKVVGNDAIGTGFVVEDKNHDKVIATAAHVVLGNKNDMHILTTDKKSLQVVGGCLIREKSENNTGVNTHYDHVVPNGNTAEFEPFDIAILRVKNPDELSEPLPLANDLVNKGKLLYVNNYQIKENGHDADINEPSSFYMIVGAIAVGNIDTIDGLEVGRKSGSYASDRSMRGGSGGPALDLDGKVVGVAYAAEPPDSYLNETDLKKDYNFIMSEEDNHLVYPSYSFYSDTKTIKQALDSPVLYEQSN